MAKEAIRLWEICSPGTEGISIKEGWRDSVLGAPRRLMTTITSLSHDNSFHPTP
ncbi:hypothetical protein PV328_011223, partial [Microctonus aethiopoides]